MCTWTLTATLFTMEITRVHQLKKKQCPSTHGSIPYPGRGEKPRHSLPCGQTLRTQCSGEKQTQKDTQGVITLMGNVQNRQIDRVSGSWAGVTANRMGLFLG